MNAHSVLGVLSLIFWSLTLIVTVKYLRYVLEADNHGEGGILALMALSLSREGRPLARRAMLLFGVIGASFLYGDGAITPAVTVLGAIEGLAIASPQLTHLVVPSAVLVLVALFALQRRGTAAVGLIFGPITLVWFVVLSALGLSHIVDAPEIQHGGWFPLLLGAGLSLLMTTWHRGRQLLAERFQRELLPLCEFFAMIEKKATNRVHGTSVFMTGQVDGTRRRYSTTSITTTCCMRTWCF